VNPAVTHARALAAMQRLNAPLITFTLEGPAVEAEDLSTTPGAETTVDAFCVSDPETGDTEAFKALSLVETSAKRLFCVPKVFDTQTKQDAKCTWHGEPMTVRHVQSLDPLGPRVGFYASLVA
jgi:hypothetical protein